MIQIGGDESPSPSGDQPHISDALKYWHSAHGLIDDSASVEDTKTINFHLIQVLVHYKVPLKAQAAV